MQLDRTTCYRALRTRDRRFDGRFFTAVKSTGVYCRPICPAPTPKLENCTFLPSAAAARELGYRPCLRCRPESSPGTPAWLGSSATVSRALRLIGEGALDRAPIEALAERLGVGGRQLRRLFRRHLGATPVAVAQTRRLQFAKKLIDETRLPFAAVAAAAGFSSVRRFNDVIRSSYARTPGELRRSGRSRPGSDLVLRLPYRPPLDWRALVGFLAPRAIPGVESVSPRAYRRSIAIEAARGWLEVRHAPDQHQLLAHLHLPDPAGLIEVSERVRRIFDLAADPEPIREQLRGDAVLRPLLRRHPGVRVPGGWDGFELAVRAILGQQVTVRGATTLSGRLVQAHGEKLEADESRPDELAFLFPRPEVLAAADLTGIGLPRARARAISTLARAVASGKLALDACADLDSAVETLRTLPGIGEWTAQYVAMRALREPDAFPAGDLGLHKAVAHGARDLPTRSQMLRLAEPWRPWRAYAAMVLWLSLTSPAKEPPR